MPFQYKHVLLIGATSGIGLAMADRLIAEGSKVIAVGRRKERLDAFLQKYGGDNAWTITFDLSKPDTFDSFVTEVTTKHPDLDCVFINSGSQTQVGFKRDPVDLDTFHKEMQLNFQSYVDLSAKFLPFLKDQKTETSIIYTNSNLSIIPAFWIPAYSASKAALNSLFMCLRWQLKDTNVNIIELSPPPVQTELHGEAGKNFGMPLPQFTDMAYKELASGKEQIFIGDIGGPEKFNRVVDERTEIFAGLSKIWASHN